MSFFGNPNDAAVANLAALEAMDNGNTGIGSFALGAMALASGNSTTNQMADDVYFSPFGERTGAQLLTDATLVGVLDGQSLPAAEASAATDVADVNAFVGVVQLGALAIEGAWALSKYATHKVQEYRAHHVQAGTGDPTPVSPADSAQGYAAPTSSAAPSAYQAASSVPAASSNSGVGTPPAGDALAFYAVAANGPVPLAPNAKNDCCIIQ